MEALVAAVLLRLARCDVLGSDAGLDQLDREAHRQQRRDQSPMARACGNGARQRSRQPACTIGAIARHLSCIAALDQLRAEGRMEVMATDVIEDNVLAFTLGDVSEGQGRRWHSRKWHSSRTAILVCERAADDLIDDPDGELDDPLEDDLPDDAS